MARDDIHALELKAKEYEKIAKHLRESARILRGLAGPVEGISEGQPVRRPDAWRTADDIELLLEQGKKAMPAGDLLNTLADRRLVAGESFDDRIANARKALTRGQNIGYLEIVDDIVRWIPGKRVNPRLSRSRK